MLLDVEAEGFQVCLDLGDVGVLEGVCDPLVRLNAAYEAGVVGDVEQVGEGRPELNPCCDHVETPSYRVAKMPQVSRRDWAELVGGGWFGFGLVGSKYWTHTHFKKF